VVGTVEAVPGAMTGAELVSAVAVGAVASTNTSTELDPEFPAVSVNDALTVYFPSGTTRPEALRPSQVTWIGNGLPDPVPGGTAGNVRTTWLELLNTSTFQLIGELSPRSLVEKVIVSCTPGLAGDGETNSELGTRASMTGTPTPWMSVAVAVPKLSGSPLNVAVTVWLPPASGPGSNVACPNASSTTVTGAPPSIVKVTVLPAGIGPAPGSGVTVAVKTTGWPSVDGLADDVSPMPTFARIFWSVTSFGLVV